MKELMNTVLSFLKAHRKTVIIGLASFVGVCLVVGVCLLVPWGARTPHFLVNTIDDLFLDTSEIYRTAEKLVNNGYRTEIDFKLDGEQANRTSDAEIHIEGLGYGIGDELKEKLDYTVKVNDNEHRGGLAYADGKLYVIGYNTEGEQFCVYLPFDNILEQLDASIFGPESGSKFAMKDKLYESIKDALENQDDSSDEELQEFVEGVLPKIKEQIQLKTVVVDKNTTSISITDETLCKIVDIVIDELTENSEVMKILSLDADSLEDLKSKLLESVKGYSIDLVYTVVRNKLESAHLSIAHVQTDYTDKFDVDLQIGSKKNTNTLKLTIDSATGPDSIRVKNTATLEYAKTESRGKTDITTAFSSKPQDGEEEKFYFTLTHDKSDGAYRLEYFSAEDSENPEMIMTGTAGYYKRQSGYYFSIDEYTDEDVSLTDLFSFSIKVDKAGQTLAMPEGENIFTLTEERFDELIHSIDYKGIDASLWIALEKKIHLSSDKLPIMNYTVALANKGAIKDLFAAYRKKNASSNIEKIYYYDEFCGVYILCEYNDRSGYSTKFYCFPGELLEGYHEVKIVNNSFVVHDNELIEKKEATCYESGYSIVKCKVCGLEQKINVTAPYYHFTYKEYFHANYYYDVGRSTEAKIEYCERCDMILQFSFNPSLPYGYEISFVADGRVNPGYNIKHLILPEFAYSHFDLSNLRLVSDKCPEIVSIRVPQGREVIATGDFVSATGLQVLWLPGSITEIEDGSFYADDDLHTIFFEGTEDEWQKINLNGYATLWSDVEIIFVPDGVDSETVMAKCTE